MSFLSRRALLGAAMLGAPAIIGARAASPRRISLTLPWVAEASNMVAYVAKAGGYWDALGLDVQVSRGYGSVAAVQAVGAGKFDFGLAAAASGIQQVAKGLPVIAIACSGYDSTMGVGVLSNSPITKPADLAGKSLGATVISGEYPFLPAFFRAVGVPPDTVHIQAADANLRTRLLIDRQVDAISGFAISIAPVVAAQNLGCRFFLFSHYGMKQYNNMLVTQPARVQSDPDLCRAVVLGLAQANKAILLNPSGAIDLFLRAVPEIALTPSGRVQTQVGLGIYMINLIDDAAKQHGLGYSDPAQFQGMIDMVARYALSPGDTAPALDRVMTNALIGQVTLEPEEWRQAALAAQPYQKYLG